MEKVSFTGSENSIKVFQTAGLPELLTEKVIKQIMDESRWDRIMDAALNQMYLHLASSSKN